MPLCCTVADIAVVVCFVDDVPLCVWLCTVKVTNGWSRMPLNHAADVEGVQTDTAALTARLDSLHK